MARSSQKLTTNSWSRWSDSFGLLISDSSYFFLQLSSWPQFARNLFAMGREFLQLTGRLEALAVFVSRSQDAMKKESTQEDAQQNPRYMQDSSKAALRFGTRKQLRGRWLRTCWANLPVNILNRQSPCSQDVEDRELTVLSSPTVFLSLYVTMKPAEFCLCWRRGIQNHVHDTPPDALAVRSADC